MMKYGEVLVYDTGFYQDVKEGSNFLETREAFSNAMLGADPPKVSIIVLCYNRLDKTKNCIESILKYTQDVDYELILCDNGSSDETLEYFQSIEHPKKIVVKVTQNHGASLPSAKLFSLANGQFICNVANDLVFTPRWLSNMLICMESDNSIGITNPMSTNVSNYQVPVGFNFANMEEFSRKAERFNVSDKSKWQERLRVVTLGTLFRRAAFSLVGAFDSAFVHNFTEDDFCLRLRRSGYKIMLCGDVIIHHDHILTKLAFDEANKYNADLAAGRALFYEKHFGLDAWDDVIEGEKQMIELLPSPKVKKPVILGIDVRMGLPILDLHNFLRCNEIFEVKSFAFTTKAKYFLDLQTVCGTNVVCDRIEYLDDYYTEKSIDYILIGEDINDYNIAKELLECLFTLLRDGGFLLYKFKTENEFKYEMIKK